MINGLSKYSKNGVSRALNYLLTNSYMGVSRIPPPALLKGNREIIESICSSLAYRHKYTSGVLSFSRQETDYIDANEGLKQQLISEFEEFCFAGIPEECRCYVAVEHRHTGRLEIHYVIPRVHLGTRKYFNPFPPGSNYSNDAFIDHMSYVYGVTNPRHVEKCRSLRVSPHDSNKDIKTSIHNFVLSKIEDGEITCAADLHELFSSSGIKIIRQGCDYLSFTMKGREKAIRLRGDIYGGKFTVRELADGLSSIQGKQIAGANEAEKRYRSVIDSREKYIASRYRYAESLPQRAAPFDDNGSNKLEENACELKKAIGYYRAIVLNSNVRDCNIRISALLRSELSVNELLHDISIAFGVEMAKALLEIINIILVIFGLEPYIWNSILNSKSRKIPEHVIPSIANAINFKTVNFAHASTLKNTIGYKLKLKIKGAGHDRTSNSTESTKNFGNAQDFS